jgi:hypothetical protein
MDSAREDLEAAMDQLEADNPEPEVAPEPEAAPGPESAPEAEPAPEPDKGEAPPETGTTSAKAAPEPKEEAPPVSEHKAPIGWSPSARESWAKVPKAIQEQVHKREVEIATAMQTTKEARRTHDVVANLARSYAPILAAEGATDPLQAIDGLFKTAAQLRVGSPQQKAEKIAELVNHYSVDIEALDHALSGTVKDPESSRLEAMLEQRLAPLNDFMAQLGSAQQKSTVDTQQAVKNEVAEFSAKAEFVNEVRMDMADLIDLASKHGRKMSLQEAYDKACALNPEVAAVVAKRKADSDMLGTSASIASKKNAASSVVGKASGTPVKTPVEGTLADELKAVWDSME